MYGTVIVNGVTKEMYFGHELWLAIYILWYQPTIISIRRDS